MNPKSIVVGEPWEMDCCLGQSAETILESSIADDGGRQIPGAMVVFISIFHCKGKH
jgi:hypothetical protein